MVNVNAIPGFWQSRKRKTAPLKLNQMNVNTGNRRLFKAKRASSVKKLDPSSTTNIVHDIFYKVQPKNTNLDERKEAAEDNAQIVNELYR
jgi:hypothetical protein